MTDKSNSGHNRMLLSHNFTLTESEVHPLNRAEFVEIFVKALDDQTGIDCTPIENPHWVVEVRYETSRYSPLKVGQLCLDALASYRIDHESKGFQIMALGGLKTTPPTGAPPALQTDEWGVDIVETRDPNMFLEEISWDKLTGTKPSESVFKVDHSL